MEFMNLLKLFTCIVVIMLFSFSFAGKSLSADKMSGSDNPATEEQERQVRESDLIKKKYPNAIKTTSGLMYIVLKEGNGPVPAGGALVEAHYTGWLVDGTKFDSSVDRGQPFHFVVGKGYVIKGWDEAFLSMKKGEKRILIIPPGLAYGDRGAGSIPPKATLIFEVELIDFFK
ncbi:MAG: FKBP-type peptidyl-prolyl cis-trans isomerase [Syntrophaceae bacterium]|nr:FKBP-type peptidyl-prolyl cis-trans isomerase [Syntrophaceae bacterium]